MSKPFARIALSLPLLMMASGLWWYGAATHQLASGAAPEACQRSLLRLFPESWLRCGDQAYYRDFDSAAAVSHYRAAISRQPLLIDAWLQLSGAELARGQAAEAGRILYALVPAITRVSTWKWRELLLAFDLRDEALFASHFNYILARLPRRAAEACQVALLFWGNWSTVASFAAEENRAVLLQELMAAGEPDAAYALWRIMDGSANPPPSAVTLRLCEVLLNAGQVPAAKMLWSRLREDTPQRVDDGGFEREPLQAAFGWRFMTLPEVAMEWCGQLPYQGNCSLRLKFRGDRNVDFAHVGQIMPVTPGRTYRLQFARRSRNLTTDQGVYLEVSGYGCQGFLARSRPVKGDSPWEEEELAMTVPAACEAVTMRVRRKASLRFDNKISGEYWLDAVTLNDAPAQEVSGVSH
jgi:hypothetical protein